MKNRGRLIVFSGPSGVGKTTVAQLLCASEEFEESVSATTRPPRGDEVDGKHYHFLTPEAFADRVKAGDFLEHAHVHGHDYGTLRTVVESILSSGRHCILNIDVQGAEQVLADRDLDALSVFLLPPDFETLERRLRARSTDSEEQIQQRLETARHEISRQHRYDHRVINAVASEAAARVADLVAQESLESGGGAVS